MYKVINDEELEKKVVVIDQADLGMRYLESWNIINEISGRKVTQSSQLNGNNADDRVIICYEHFRKLLWNSPEVTYENEEIPPVFENLHIKDDIFTFDEYKKAITKMWRCSWEDDIMPEVFKYVPIDYILLYIINKSYINSEQLDLYIFLTYSHYLNREISPKLITTRGISLNSIMAKTYNPKILNRIRPVLDHLLRPNQNGFRMKISTAGQLLAIRRILDGIMNMNLLAVLTYIDFKKAFNSIHRWIKYLDHMENMISLIMQ